MSADETSRQITLVSGDTLGGYVLDARLGEGGFGSVWRARSPGTGEVVAIKLLTGAYAGPDAARQRAQIELLAASAAEESQHVVRVLESGDQPVPYVVMEYIDGTDLKVELTRRRSLGQKLNEGETLQVARGVADALGALAAAGIIHRDVKPANVMLDRFGRVKLVDFGIAKIVGYDAPTQSGALSALYAAPEVWEGKATHLSDLYALGAVLFECLAGEPPFAGGFAELYRLHREIEPDLSRLPPSTSPALALLVRDLLQKDPAKRPANAQVCLERISQAEQEAARRRQDERARRPLPEPEALGPWLIRAKHPSRPWSFVCEHQDSGERATVEVHFTSDPAFFDRLERTMKANPVLVPLGAERLIDSGRLIAWGRAWNSPPPGAAQFYVARDERQLPARPAALTTQALEAVTSSLIRLSDEAARHGVDLAFSPADVGVWPDGRTWLARPGLPAIAGERALTAIQLLQSLPLEADGRAAVDGAGDLLFVQSRLAGDTRPPSAVAAVVAEHGTRVVPPGGSPTVVVPAAGGRSSNAPVAVPPAAVERPGQSSGRRRVVLGALLAAVCVGAAAGLAVTLLRGDGGSKGANPERTPTPPPGTVGYGDVASAIEFASGDCGPLATNGACPEAEIGARDETYCEVIYRGSDGTVAGGGILKRDGKSWKWERGPQAGTPPDAGQLISRSLPSELLSRAAEGWNAPDGSLLARTSKPAATGLRTRLDERWTLGPEANPVEVLGSLEGHFSDWAAVDFSTEACQPAPSALCGTDYRRVHYYAPPGAASGGAAWQVLVAEVGNGRLALSFIAAPAPDGRLLAQALNGKVATSRGDGAERAEIQDPAVASFPSWSPDGRRVVYSARGAPGARRGLVIANADGSGRLQLTPGGDDIAPAWSPDGSRVAFASDRSGNFELYVVNVDGTGLEQLTKESRVASWPSWSPDGSRIAFESEREGPRDIYLLALSSGAITRLTNSPEYDAEAAFSPDGQQLLFASGVLQKPGSFRIYSLRLSDGAVTRLTDGPGDDREPAWTRAGTTFTFTRLDAKNTPAIFLWTGRGEVPVQISGYEGGAYHSSWAPAAGDSRVTPGAATPTRTPTPSVTPTPAVTPTPDSRPDFRVSDAAWRNGAVVVTIVNDGGDYAGPLTIQARGEGVDTQPLSKTVNLKRGGFDTIAVRAERPAEKFSVTVTVDPSNAVAESNETNNARNFDLVAVTASPRYAIARIEPGQKVVVVTVRNDGPPPAAAQSLVLEVTFSNGQVRREEKQAALKQGETLQLQVETAGAGEARVAILVDRAPTLSTTTEIP